MGDPGEPFPSGAPQALAERAVQRLLAGTVAEIGDMAVLLSAGDAVRAGAMEELVGGLAVCARPPDVTLSLIAEPPEEPSRPPDNCIGDLWVWHDGHRLSLRHGCGLRAVATPTDGRIGGDGEIKVGFRQLFPWVLTHVLVFAQRYVVHAGVIAHDDRAYLVLGATGQGKSTLALAALRAGWKLLGDDIAILRHGPDGFETTGLARAPSVPADLGGWPAWDSPVAGLDARGRRQLPVESLTAGWLPLAGVILSAHGDAHSGRIERLGPAEVLRAALWSFTSSANPYFVQSWLGHCAALSRLPAWKLSHGRDARGRVADGMRFLEVVRATPAV